ncbi:MAG: GTPase domain-containing protein, partial [Candidatus Brocadiae bacterium]|nr:GTPase domain-containing protein [Candidatus Brocadiia bacterium]
MKQQIPDFPHNDQQSKVIALLGYTGVGKTSLITAGYFENIMSGKDAFTQRFFQRIEDQIRESGGIPLTMGEASTLSFIEPSSRSEFTIQDFSGEHIKLERQDKQEYQKLIVRADDSHALVCLLSAENFYKSTQIYEEVDAIQTFVNRLRGLGTRIPVVILLSKCDRVPRFYMNMPVLKSLCCFLSRLPWMRLPSSRGLEVTMKRFPAIFSGFQFKGKGPQVQFSGISIPRLGRLKPWQWPRGLRFIAKIFRKLWIDTQWIFQANYNLEKPFQFCFQAFQLSILRDLLVKHYDSPETCQAILQKFSKEVVEKKIYGEQFYFQDYFERIQEDTGSLISEMKEEIQSLQQSASLLLAHERDLGQNVRLWLEKMNESLSKFKKPWSQGAKQTLESLRYDTLHSLKDRFHVWLTESSEDKNVHAFYRLVDILRLRKEMGEMEIWAALGISLPDVSFISKKLLDLLIRLVLSRSEISISAFEEDKSKYLDVLTITPPQELVMLENMVKAVGIFYKNLGQYELGSGKWNEEILGAFKSFDQEWIQLAKKIELDDNSPLRAAMESKLVKVLKKEASQFLSLSQILEWTTETEQFIRVIASRHEIAQVQGIVAEQSDQQLKKVLGELKLRSQKLHGTGKFLPLRLKEWFEESERCKPQIASIAGNKGLQELEKTSQEVLRNVSSFLQDSMKSLLSRKADSVSFSELSEILEIYIKIEKTDLFSKNGQALPSVEEMEKALFTQLACAMICRNGITYTFYEQERAKFLNALRGSAPVSLESLDNMVSSFVKLQKGTKDMASLPAKEWEEKVLAPVRAFHCSYKEVLAKVSLTEDAMMPKEAERCIVQSLQSQLPNLSLNDLRDWISLIDPFIEREENRSIVDKILKEAENNIRKQFQQDLQDFISRCEQLQTSADSFKGKRIQEIDKKEVQERWEHFAGSVLTLEYSAKKFPKTELSFDEGIRKTLHEQAPMQYQKGLEAWINFLMTQNLLRRTLCKEILSSIEIVRVIFERPEAFRSLSQHLEKIMTGLQKKKFYWLSAAAACLMFAILFLGFVYQRYLISQKILETQNFAKQYPEKHSEIIERWGQIFYYPRFFFSSEDWKTSVNHKRIQSTIAELDSIELKILGGNLSEESSIKIAKQLQSLGQTNQEQEIKLKAQKVFLEWKASRFLAKIREGKTEEELLDKEWQDLQKQESNFQQTDPFFYSK